jgi:DNA polymerase elongation subunit (family B)
MKGGSFAAAWEGLFGSLEYIAVMKQDKNTEITIDWEGRVPTVHTADQVYEMIFGSDKKWMISANGTIFRYDIEGIVPSLLARWYKERKELQKKKKEATEKEDIAFWDKRQLVKKINLNSLYGALLNPGCRFHDHRIGQSTTLTGRIIAKHMDAVVNESITGIYAHDGDAIVYGDTDSCYFSAWPVIESAIKEGKMEWSKDICVELYDSIADQVNDSFPDMMWRECKCPLDRGDIIKGGRELIATNGLFIKKKRYAVLIFDMEGTRYDLMDAETAKKKGVTFGHGKIKAMGLDLKRSDTPKVVQDFLSRILLNTLLHVPKEKIISNIRTFKEEFASLPAWEKGTPKRVNNLTKYTKEYEDTGGCRVGHVMAAINWNNLRRMHGDNYSQQIVDGMKVIVCKLRPNPMGYTSVAYPIDVLHIPEWFKTLPFDNGLMETTIVDKKVENLLGVLKWDLTNNTQIKTKFDSLFSFE